VTDNGQSVGFSKSSQRLGQASAGFGVLTEILSRLLQNEPKILRDFKHRRETAINLGAA
jgi:hypothetical protein